MGDLEQALPAFHGRGESASFVAEQFVGQERVKRASAVEHDERRVGAGALPMDLAGDQLLAHAALALDEHGAVGLRGELDERADLHGFLAAPDEFGGYGEPLQFSFEQHVLFAESFFFIGFLDKHLQLVESARFVHIIVCAQLHRFDRRFDRSRAREDDNLHGRVRLFQRREKLYAVHPGHPDVHEGDVEQVLACDIQCLPARRGAEGVESFAPETLVQSRPKVVFVVDYEHCGKVMSHVRCFPPPCLGIEG